MAKLGKHGVESERKRKVPLKVKVLVPLGVLACGLVVAIGLCAFWLSDLPEVTAEDFDRTGSTTVYASDRVTVLARFQLQNRDPLPSLSEASDDVIKGTIATEDERFYNHGGVDLEGIARALVNNLTGGELEGASTITQQLVRNTVLADEMNDISIKRKVREIALALKMEQYYTKDQILLLYLNTINYGSGAYGIEAAAQRYFSKPACQLKLAEAALLVGIPQSPTYNNPIDNPENAKSRRNLVLDRMASNGYITEEEAQTAKNTDVKLSISAILDDGILKYPYFTSYVRDQLLNQLSYDDVFQGSLTVYTTLDPDTQDAAEEAAQKKMEQMGEPFECAMTAIDPNTGYVKAMVGGKDYRAEQFNLAAQGRRQAGSSFKTFTLIAALEQGISPDTPVKCNAKVTIGDWDVHNYANHSYGTRSISSAFAVSSNTGFARLVTAVGPEAVVDVAKRMGITSELEAVPAITLGVEEVTTLEMANAYATIASGGIHHEATVFELVKDRHGNAVIDNTNPTGTQAISREVAHAAVGVMQGVVQYGTGTAANLWKSGQKVAGKTGTTENDRDKWFCGITPQLSTAVWIGDRSNQRSPWTTAVSAYADFMNAYMEGLEPQEFFEAEDPEYTKTFNNSDLDIESLTYSSDDEKKKKEEAKTEEEEPASSEEPSKPDTPTQTEQPSEPETPSQPETPETPDPPAKPEEPDPPAEPEEPSEQSEA